MPKLALINSEGDILSIKKDRNNTQYEVIDEFGTTLTHWDNIELIDFIIGNSSITDSTNRTWNFYQIHRSMRVMPDKIAKFLKDTL